MLSAEQLADYYRQACELELQAFKVGNVSVYADGHDMTVADFRLSAEVSAEPLCNPRYSLGEKIFYAVKATREAVGCNTNLGIILLCAPLIEAMNFTATNLTLRQALHHVLNNTTVADAEWTFKAITLASPAGLGDVNEHDVHQTAVVTLREAMAVAEQKDQIAVQYLTDYKDIFDFACLTYYNAMDKWGSRDWAIVAVYLDLLQRYPDSHIMRKYGKDHAETVSKKIASLQSLLETNEQPEQLLPLFYQMDQELKAKGINPGTTADMSVATALAVQLQQSFS